MKLIDKAAVMAEINRRIKEIDEIGTYLSPKGVLTNLLCSLDTLEVKEVDSTDAFIEKIERYLQEHLIDYWSQSVTDESKFIEDFKNYMKEE